MKTFSNFRIPGLLIFLSVSILSCNNNGDKKDSKDNPQKQPRFVGVSGGNLCMDTATLDFYEPYVQLSNFRVLPSTYAGSDIDQVTVTFKIPRGYSISQDASGIIGPVIKTDYDGGNDYYTQSKKYYFALGTSGSTLNSINTLSFSIPVIDIINNFEFVDIRVFDHDTSVVKGHTILHHGYVAGIHADGKLK